MKPVIQTEAGPVAAVAFDMDGLMFDTERIMLTMWARAAERFGWNLTEELLRATVGVSAEGTRDMIMEACGPDFPHDAVRAVRLVMEKEYFETYGVPHKHGLSVLLEFLAGHGIACGVATSTSSERALYALERAGVMGYFRAVVCGDEVARCKPDPEIYEILCSHLEVEPYECLVLEDSRAGILAAHAAGCLPVMIPDLVEPDEVCREKAFRFFFSLEDVYRWLRLCAG